MNKAISFFLGLLMGIMICILLFYYDVKIFEAKCIENTEKEIITIVTTDTVYIATPFKAKKQNVEITPVESVVVDNVEDSHFENAPYVYETEFSLDEIEQGAPHADRLLQSKTVKVKLLPLENQEAKQPEYFFYFFEIQQWSTPIKNRITYFRDNNMLKIKGMDVANVGIVFWDNLYLLEIGDRYYAIPETKNFEKLNLIQLPQ